MIVDRAKGSFVYINEVAYRDLSYGSGVHLFGHSPEYIIDTVYEEVQRQTTTQRRTKNIIELENLLSDITGYKNFLICNTGAEGIQKAIRIARVSSKSKKIAVFKKAWHGMVDDTLEDYQDAISQHDTVFLNRDLKSIFSLDDTIGIVIVEPIPQRYPCFNYLFLNKLREICDQKGIVLISDEIISGFRLKYSFDSDIKIYGKALSAGLPISVIAYKDWLNKEFPKGGTFSGNNISVSCALATLENIKKHNIEYLYELGNSLRHVLNDNKVKNTGFGGITRITGISSDKLSDLLFDQRILFPKNKIIYNAYNEKIKDVIEYGEKISEAYHRVQS